MILEFLAIFKKTILLFLFFRLCVAKTFFFLVIKLPKINQMGGPNTPLSLKRPYKK